MQAPENDIPDFKTEVTYSRNPDGSYVAIVTTVVTLNGKVIAQYMEFVVSHHDLNQIHNIKAMKFITLIMFSLISLSAYSQPKGIKCIYSTNMPVTNELYEIENPFARDIMIKAVKEDKKVYSLTGVDGKFLCVKEPETHETMPLTMDKLQIYVDFNDNVEVSQVKYANKLYLIKDTLEKYEWDISDSTKQISGYNCYKAKLKGKPGVTAWFTPDVPFGCAPYGYYGLPGLVVHMEIPMFNLDLESITEVDGVQLNPPTEGKPTTEEGLTKDANKALEELMNKADKVTKIE